MALIALFATVCSSGSVVPEGPYADDIRVAQATASSDFEKEAFADSVITR